MDRTEVRCALLAAMLARHGWGTPIGEDALLSMAAIPTHEYAIARAECSDLRAASYIEHLGNRGIRLDNSAFGALADLLYHECGWEPYEIELRLKHYEGWDDHDWA